MNGKAYYEKLALKWLQGTITEAEKIEFTDWYNGHDDRESFLSESFAGNEQELEQRIFEKVKQLLEQSDPPQLRKRKMPWPKAVAVAATLLVSFSLGVYLWQQAHPNSDELPNVTHDVQPGGNKATLTLADGRVVELSEEQTGITLKDGEVHYEDGSQLAAARGLDVQDAPFISMTTPKGGRYRVTLSDGTAVWLNSASTLRYPARFTKGTRLVELDGEGYFDVSPDENRPFVVKCAGQQVEVLGTAFNINSYKDEESIRTTLVHGKVRLINDRTDAESRILRPGQQALLQETGFAVVDVDTEEVTAWKEGYFQFNNTDMRTVMKQLARWYDIEVTYENSPGNPTFGGRIPMDMTLDAVLKVLAATGIDFEIKADRQLVVKGK